MDRGRCETQPKRQERAATFAIVIAFVLGLWLAKVLVLG
jgi:hypothetical protein